MKKLSILCVVLFAALAMTGCKNSQPKEAAVEKEAEGIDYAALVEKEFPTVEEFATIVDYFQEGTRNLISTGQVWDNNEKEIKEVFGAKGFEVERFDDFGFSASALKNCELIKNQDYTTDLKATNGDGISAGIRFVSMGDMYVMGMIKVFDENIYKALVDKVKAAGYEPDADHDFVEENCEYYKKGNYFFECNNKELTLSLHYDFMAAQGIGF